MTSTGEGMRAIAEAVHAAICGDEPKLTRAKTEGSDDWVDVLAAPDRPGEGSTAFGTVGMSKFDMGMAARGQSVRVELVGSITSLVPEFGQALASAALQVASGEYRVQPGTIMPDLLGQFRDDVYVPHLLFVPPFQWELPNLDVDGALVAWLQVVPITQAEYDFSLARGSSTELQDLLEAAAADPEHAWRDSVTPA